ncbi:iron-sulfur cluster assembly scaffold protein [Parerythrobacter aurantius]|uniref:iron-sulfur cluster assembly scaffold protein n=1 Tax=Parerythrobacter aurantius TaxID=3127706 RepID=UPI00324EC745
MARAAAAPLYTREILALAVELAKVPYDPAMPLSGSARSRSCGSLLELSAALDGQGQLSGIGLRVSACAVGQASAAIFARHAIGRGLAEIAGQLAGIEAWLGDDGPLPTWPDLAMLEPARAFPARHGAILLPWKAGIAALSNDPHGS